MADGQDPLRLTAYEGLAEETDKLEPSSDTAILGLVGEVGSLVSALKKKRRDTDAFFGYHHAVVEELGDVLWYVSAVARRGGTSLAEAFALAAASRLPSETVSFEDYVAVDAADRGTEAAFERALLELVGEAGDLSKRFATGVYRDNTDALRGDLVKLVRPLARAAAATEVGLAEAARFNIAKIEDRWVPARAPAPLFDQTCHVDERLPRSLRVAIYEREVGGRPYVFQKANGLLIGDRLTDNHIPEDDYRFHDVFHLAHAAILGWSPVTRALLKLKRKSIPDVDENEDGARAILIEEGVTTWIFETAKRHNFFANTSHVGFDLLKSIRQFVRGYEAERAPMWLWEQAILQGYAAFRRLKTDRRGVAVVDMDARCLTLEPLPPGQDGFEL